MKKIKSPTTAIIIIAAVIYLTQAVSKQNSDDFSINIDLANPLSVVWPCEITVVTDSGDKGIRIAPNIGRGWNNEAAGSATYSFFVPEKKQYQLWSHCLWFDECTNAIYAKFDNQKKFIIGNDPVYNKWHWTKGPQINLEKGTHILILSNHSDHIAMDKIILTTSETKTPDDSQLVFSDIFYEGFDGCDLGNFSQWKIASGNWYVKPKEPKSDLTQNNLIGKSKSKALITYNRYRWQNYSVAAEIKICPNSPEASASVCFGLKDNKNYLQLKIKPSRSKNKAKLSLLQISHNKTRTIAEVNANFSNNTWNDIQITVQKTYIEVAVDNSPPVKLLINTDTAGGIALLLNGDITAYFDNIHVSKFQKSTNKRTKK